MEIFGLLSVTSLALSLVSFCIIVFRVRKYRQPMRVMNLVWPLTALWGGGLALWAYFSFGKAERPGMKMDMGDTTPFRQKIALSTFHCGAGCTLADIMGETFGTKLLSAWGLQGIGWSWGLDYFLALLIGACFQYAAIRLMRMDVSPGEVFAKALKVDFLSLTAWQAGMYILSYIVFFVILGRPMNGSKKKTNSIRNLKQVRVVNFYFVEVPPRPI